MRCLMSCLTLGALLIATMPVAHAAYPTPETAGFHHCALIYDKNTRSAADFAPYVAYDKQPVWLFDAFLFLIQNSGRGRGTEYGLTEKVDWDYQLDRWFSPDRDLATLDQAVEDAGRRLGAPPARRRIMLAIPYVNRGVTAFGTIDGKPIDLSTEAGRNAAVSWYVSEASRRFAAGRYRHLQLWGFYWMREDIPEEDVSLVKAAADIVHGAGFRLLWIPCNGDTGIERWKRAGVDVAIYQPNYAFGTWQNGGRIGRNRIATTAASAKANGLGVEIEANSIDSSPADRRVFAQYLADGAAGRYGYQAAATAYYLSTDLVEQTSRSTDPESRRSYDLLAQYVTNRAVPDPDPPVSWRWSSGNGLRTAEARFSMPRRVAAVEVFLDWSKPVVWGGSIEVSLLKRGTRKWSAGGWAIRGLQPPVGKGPDWVCVPVGAEAVALRVSFRPIAGAGPLALASLAIDPNGVEDMRTHLALDRPYAISPTQRGKYADTGRMLADGIAQGGYRSGRTIGWMANGRSVSVSFDLGRALPISEVRAFTQGGGVGAVYWPTAAMALLAVSGTPPESSEGRGSLPRGFRLVSGSGVHIDRRRAGNDMDGHISFRPAKPVRSRYVTLISSADQWLMLSEVRIFANGRNVAPASAYTLRPSAGGAVDELDAAYADDSVRLTDGAIARDFSPRQLTGWRDDRPRTITVDLQQPRRVREVAVWSLCGGGSGIYAPSEVRVETSTDRKAWQLMGIVHPADKGNRGVCEAMAARAKYVKPRLARFVRVRVVHHTEWAMLSEIEVH